MDKKNRNARGYQSEGRQDLFLWSRVHGNLKNLNTLKEENLMIQKYIIETKKKLGKASPESSDILSSKLHKYLKEGQASGARMKILVADIKNDLKSLKLMQTPGDFNPFVESIPASSSNNTSRLPSRPKQASPKNYIPNGSMVAAKMIDSKDANQEWILATVIHYYPDRNKYQVEDAEADELDGEKTKYILDAKYVIQLPDEQELTYQKEFPVGHEVLALYPNTTCFYKATVVIPPSKNRGRGHHAYDYMVHFDDDDNADRFIQRMNIVNMPDIHKSR